MFTVSFTVINNNSVLQLDNITASRDIVDIVEQFFQEQSRETNLMEIQLCDKLYKYLPFQSKILKNHRNRILFLRNSNQ